MSSATFTLGRGGSTFAANQFCAVVVSAHLSSAQHGALHAALSAYLSVLGVAELPIATATRALATTTPLPDGGTGAVSGKGWTCTGLARLPDGSWLIGNDGRGANATDPNAASIVHLSADRTTILHQWTVAAMGLPAGSVQGVAWQPTNAGGERGRLWFALVGSGVHAVSISDGWAAGQPVLLPGSSGANGIAFDTLRGQIIVLGGSEITWRDSSSGQIVTSVAIHAAEADHLFHDAVDDQLYYSFGANGSSGGIVRLDPAAAISYGAPAVRTITTLSGADAIEGIVLAEGQWHVANDAFFHGGNPALNRILQYLAT